MTTRNDAGRDFDASDCSAALDVIPRLLDIGYTIQKQDGEWWMFEGSGESVVGGATFREMCERLVGVDVKEHERRHSERCEWGYNDEHERWDTQCDDVMVLHLGESPFTYGFKVCPYCGKQLLDVSAKRELDR